MVKPPPTDLPWVADWAADALRAQRGHALLAQVPAGSGALAFALTAARAWLCEGGDGSDGQVRQRWRACGRCASCHLTTAHTHPDLRVVAPEAVAMANGLPVEIDEKRKPSRQIRIDDVRALIDWMATTSGRGRGKVAVIHPAESMNVAAATALLKTLEEPPPGAHWLLTTADAALLLPTVRSRCQQQTLPPIPRALALDWLVRQGVDAADILLDAAAGQPLAALQWHREGLTGALWADLPGAVARGDASTLATWGVPRVIDALQKLCHDAAVIACGGPPRFFPSSCLTPDAQLPSLIRWHQRLQSVMRHAEHPWSEALLVEALVSEGQQAWAPPASRRKRAEVRSSVEPCSSTPTAI